MKTGTITSMACAAALAALTATFAGAPLSAQSSGDCRCADRDGNPIERCSCFRAPSFERVFGGVARDAQPRIGISVDPQQSARRDAQGATVTDVLEDGPADEAGIRRGDVITSLDGHSLFQPLDGARERDFDLDRSVPVQRLLAIAADLEPGEDVEIEFLRDGDPRTARVEAQELAAWGSGAYAGSGWNGRELRGQLRELTDGLRTFEFRGGDLDEFSERLREDEDGRFPMAPRARGTFRFHGGGDGSAVVIDRYRGLSYGLELVALNPSLGAYFGAEVGVLVADADEESTLGLRPGDVVVRIGERDVTTPDRMRRILQSYGPDEEITLQIRRDGRNQSVTGKLGG
jgi:hypothetical protein